MKNFMDLIKGNPVVVASIAVAVLALAALFLLVRPQGAAFIEQVKKRQQDTQALDALMRTPVPVPPPTPDGDPITINVTVNDTTNKALIAINENMASQAQKVFGNASKINQMYHTPMMENLFPTPADDGLRFQARDEYIRQLKLMLGKPSIADKDAARLNASDRIPEEDLDRELAKVTSKFLAGFFPRKSESELTADDQKKLAGLRRSAAMGLLQEHALRTSIYASNNEKYEDFPFQIDAWAQPGPQPAMSDIWEGQMKLWIQQDIVRAIALANTPDRSPGAFHQQDTVITAPVKHLLSIRVNDDYVGITGSGAMSSFSNTRQTNVPMDYIRGDASKLIIEEIKQHNPDKRLPEAFNLSLTGRVGNALYDVRHVEVSVIAEFRQLPELYKAIGKVNYMTVLSTRITDEDEYLALQNYYVYGQQDCVRVDLLIETIWLRDWTSKLMPQEVKDRLGIVDKPATAATTPTTP